MSEPKFLCATLYANDIGPLRSFYVEGLGLRVDYEESAHIVAMSGLCLHDPSEGPAGSVRLYFTVEDPEQLATDAAASGIQGVLRVDGVGNPAWESTDPFGNSVVVLQGPSASPESTDR